jgi:hypothetical protein
MHRVIAAQIPAWRGGLLAPFTGQFGVESDEVFSLLLRRGNITHATVPVQVWQVALKSSEDHFKLRREGDASAMGFSRNSGEHGAQLLAPGPWIAGARAKSGIGCWRSVKAEPTAGSRLTYGLATVKPSSAEDAGR